MATDPHNNDHAHHADVDYERSDLGHRGIWLFFSFLAVSVFVIAIAIGALYKGFNFAEAKLAPESNPMAVNQQAPPPALMQNTSPVDFQKFSSNGTQPLLQFNEVGDMQAFRAEEEKKLNDSPWKDENGNVHLPIALAMQLVSQRNQPSRANGNDPSIRDPKVVPSEGGFLAAASVQQQADATSVEGAPVGDSMNHSEDSGATGEHPSTSPEQKLKTPPATTKAPKK
jgi:hypothetical protein